MTNADGAGLAEYRLSGEGIADRSILAMGAIGAASALFAAWIVLADASASLDAAAPGPEQTSRTGSPDGARAGAEPTWCPEIQPIAFDFASATPAPLHDGGQLNGMLNWLNAHPASKVALEGHADSVGAERSNLLLSYERARAVGALLSKAGVPAQRILIAAAGSHEPMEGMPADARINRRVTLRIVDPGNCRNTSADQ